MWGAPIPTEMVSEISSRLRVGDVKEGGSSRVEDVVASFIALVEDSVTGMVIVSPVGRFTFEDWEWTEHQWD